MKWNAQQSEALEKIGAWYAEPSTVKSKVYYLAGYAGTGKTTLARALPVKHPQYMAFTGKAALVMRQKGCTNASTIHSFIYNSHEHGQQRIIELRELLKRFPGDKGILKEIADERELLKSPSWHLKNPEQALRWRDRDGFQKRINAFVIDECSMVDERIGKDLMSFGVPILVIGDPAQLRPVFGEGYFTKRAPDYLLTDIQRQALESPVLYLAHLARKGQALPMGPRGSSLVCTRRALTDKDFLAADMILVGRNVTRISINAHIRALKGFKTTLPQPGERIVCLRNNHEIGVLNGQLWDVVERVDNIKNMIDFEMRIKSVDNNREIVVNALKCHFNNTERPDFVQDDQCEFTYGYALTTHKAQGSEWPHVIYIDEWFRDGRKEHVYTGITRASERITVVRTR